MPDLTNDQLRAIRAETHTRTLHLDRAAANEEARTIEVAFSSEEPYRRWWGTEILGHDAAEVDMEFIASGRAPLLAGHDMQDQVGVIEKAWLDKDRKGRALVRFGRSARADEFFKDVLDGIRANISVGYRVHDMQLESSTEAEDVYRVTKWEPLEVSLVSVPADTSVGVGRGAEPAPQTKEDKAMPDIDKKTDTTPPVDPVAIAAEARQAETARIRNLVALGKQHAMPTDAERAIEAGTSVDQFRAQVLDTLAKRAEEQAKAAPATIGMSQREVGQFSMLKLVRALATNDWSQAGFERECSQAFEQKSGKTAKGAFIPPDVLIDPRYHRRDLATNVGNAGGYLVAETLQTGSFIDLLRNTSVAMRMGARVLNGLVGDADIPKQTGGATAYWINEGGTLTESQQTLGQIRLTPKTVGCFTDMTRRMMLQSSIDVENFIRSDFAAQIALAIDSAALNGSGVNGQPLGIIGTTGIGSVTLNAQNAPDWGNIVDMETAVSTDNALVGTLGYVSTATITGKMKQTERTSGNGIYILDGNTLNGYPYMMSNNVPAKYILFGNWADLIIATWSGLDVTVDTTTLGTSGGTRIIAFQDVDVAVRHAESFCAGYAA